MKMMNDNATVMLLLLLPLLLPVVVLVLPLQLLPLVVWIRVEGMKCRKTLSRLHFFTSVTSKNNFVLPEGKVPGSNPDHTGVPSICTPLRTLFDSNRLVAVIYAR